MKKRLITLLTMGRTLDRAKDRKGAYTLRHVNKFPKFTPVARVAAAAGAAPVGQSVASAQPTLFEAAKAPGAVVAAEKRVDRTDRSDRADQTCQPPATKVGILWLAKLKAFLTAVMAFVPRIAVRLRGKVRAPVSDSRPRAQAELALEKVTVLRNDLSDADVVVVAVQRKPENSRAVQAETGGPSGNAWTRVTARWVKLKNPEEVGSPASAAHEARAGRPADLAQTPS